MAQTPSPRRIFEHFFSHTLKEMVFPKSWLEPAQLLAWFCGYGSLSAGFVVFGSTSEDISVAAEDAAFQPIWKRR